MNPLSPILATFPTYHRQYTIICRKSTRVRCIRHLNLDKAIYPLKHGGYYMYHLLQCQKNIYITPTQCIYAFNSQNKQH
jgi:hypothetical protein